MTKTVRVSLEEETFEKMEATAGAALGEPEIVRMYVSLGMDFVGVREDTIQQTVENAVRDAVDEVVKERVEDRLDEKTLEEIVDQQMAELADLDTDSTQE